MRLLQDPSSPRPGPIPARRKSLFWKASADQRRPWLRIRPLRPTPPSRDQGGWEDEEKVAVGWRLSSSLWNLQAIARAPGSLIRFMPDDIPGVTSPMVYIGMLFSWFAYHIEDHELHSLNE